MRVIFLLLWLMSLLADRADCTSIVTPEGTMVRTLGHCVELYLNKYGALPTEWVELDEFLPRPVDDYYSFASPSKRYLFITNLTLPSPNEGELLAIMRNPGYEANGSMEPSLMGPGRYIIFRNSKGEIKSRWVAENYVIRAFASANQPLPIPDTEPEQIYIVNVRKSAWKRRAIDALMVLIAAAVVGWIIVKAWTTRVEAFEN